MHSNTYSILLLPLLAWAATVCVILVAYLGSLYIQERRINRRFNEERARLGLPRV